LPEKAASTGYTLGFRIFQKWHETASPGKIIGCIVAVKRQINESNQCSILIFAEDLSSGRL
jgi:hypothetical protein